MEYSSIQSSTLGGSQIQGLLASSLNSGKYTVEKKGTNVVFEPTGQFFAPLVDNDVIDTSNNEQEEEDEDEHEHEQEQEKEKEETNDRFQFTKDPINSFFIGSITIVGLFVLYRLLQKNK